MHAAFDCVAYQALETQLGSSRELKPKKQKPASPALMATASRRDQTAAAPKTQVEKAPRSEARSTALPNQNKKTASRGSSGAQHAMRRKAGTAIAQTKKRPLAAADSGCSQKKQRADISPELNPGGLRLAQALCASRSGLRRALESGPPGGDHQGDAAFAEQEELASSSSEEEQVDESAQQQPVSPVVVEPRETAEERKRRWERHIPTTMVKVTQRLAQEGGSPFKWVSMPAHLQPSTEVARTYPWVQRAWETMTVDDVKKMTGCVWNDSRLSEAPVYLGWLVCKDHPAVKHGNHVHNQPQLELGVFASRDIQKGESVLNYVGAPISFDDANGSSLYSQGFSPGNETLRIELDAGRYRNLGPMVNDYRDDVRTLGVSGCGFRRGGVARGTTKLTNTRTLNLKPHHTYWMLGGDVTPGKFPLITLKADRPIAKGEELLWDYGKDYWRVFAEKDDE